MSLHPLTIDQKALLDEFNQSGLSIYDFAQQKGMSYSSVHYVIDKDRRIRNENINNGFVPIPLNKEMLLPSQTHQSTHNGSNNLISFKLNGIDITIDTNNLKQFLKVIQND